MTGMTKVQGSNQTRPLLIQIEKFSAGWPIVSAYVFPVSLSQNGIFVI